MKYAIVENDTFLGYCYGSGGVDEEVRHARERGFEVYFVRDGFVARKGKELLRVYTCN
jgi:hypothetical protein